MSLMMLSFLLEEEIKNSPAKDQTSRTRLLRHLLSQRGRTFKATCDGIEWDKIQDSDLACLGQVRIAR